MTTALPDVPTCWSWPEPLRPVANSTAVLRAWHEGRCAICGRDVPDTMYDRLVEDHDHFDGRVRGYLCERDNLMEGKSDHPVFVAYRERFPAEIVGVLATYKRKYHPDITASWDALGLAWAETSRKDPATWSPLAVALDRVGLTGLEWSRRQDPYRRFVS